MRNPFRISAPSMILAQGVRIAWAVCLALGCAHAEWKSQGPMGGDFWKLHAIEGDLFAIGGGGIWRSPDGGASWAWAQSSVPHFITDMAASGSGLYAVNNGVFQSTDRGVSWKRLAITTLPEDEISMRVGQSIVSMGRFLIVGTSSGIFRSANSGLAWNRVDAYRDSDGTPLDVHSLAVRESSVFANSPRGLLVSTDSGAAGSWKVASKGPDGYVGALTIMGRYLFADAWEGLVRSSNQGRDWDTVSHLSGIDMLVDGKRLYRSTSASQTVTPAAKPGLYLSLDSGATWALQNEGVTISAMAARNDTLFVSMPGQGVLLSTDNGKHFQACPIPGAFVFQLGATGTRILAPGDKDMGDFISADQGATWTRTTAPGSGLDFTHMAVGGSLGFGIDGRNHMSLSRDSGKTWTKPPGAFPADTNLSAVQRVAIHAGCLFISYRDGIYRSTDTGKTWSQVRPQKSSGTALEGVVLLSAGTELLLSEKAGIFRSTDTGATWTPAQTNPNGLIRGMALQHLSPGAVPSVYAVGRSGVFRSLDRGVTWTERNPDQKGFRYLAATGDAVIASHDTLGLFLSKDGGTTWSSFNTGLPDAFRTTALLVTDAYAFVGVGNAGVWRRPLSELTEGTGLRQKASAPEAVQGGLRLVRTAAGMGVEFGLRRAEWVRLEGFDQRGRRIAVLVDGPMGAGRQRVALPQAMMNADVGPGILRLQAGGMMRSRIVVGEEAD
jgi:photosystem II stability/assembly factor-like uncharacterized protein